MSERPLISVVTGAAGGLGRAITAVLLERGDQVVATDLSAEALNDLRSSVDKAGDRLATVVADVAHEEGWERIRDEAGAAFGAPNVLVNNAGISPKVNGAKRPGVEIPIEEWNTVLAVNLTGAFLGIRTLAPAMQAQGFGRVVNMVSVAARNGGRLGGIHYAATKTGLLGVTRAFATELAGFGITVNAVAPGRIDGGMAVRDTANSDYVSSIPVGRLGTAADVARTVEFLTEVEAGFITGTTTDVNGGSQMQ